MKTYLEMACEHMKSVISDVWDEWNIPKDIKETLGRDPMTLELYELAYYLHTFFIEDPFGFFYDENLNYDGDRLDLMEDATNLAAEWLQKELKTRYCTCCIKTDT